MADRAEPFRILLADDEETFREDIEAALREARMRGRRRRLGQGRAASGSRPRSSTYS